jgi:DNA-binding NarL/FixJ family response regulator
MVLTAETDSVLRDASPDPTASEAIRLVIADDYPIFRDGLRRLLETAPDLRIVGHTDTSGAILLVQTLRPDVLLLGGSAAGTLEALERTLAAGTSVKVILLPRSVDGPEVGAALRFGAHGILPKDTTADVLFKSIKAVVAGHYWVGFERASDLADGIRRLGQTNRRAKAFGLTSRELEIVRAVLSGETNKAIAQHLSISENTVKRHLTHIFDKVGASTRVELALFATHHQLVTQTQPGYLSVTKSNETIHGSVRIQATKGEPR